MSGHVGDPDGSQADAQLVLASWSRIRSVRNRVMSVVASDAFHEEHIHNNRAHAHFVKTTAFLRTQHHFRCFVQGTITFYPVAKCILFSYQSKFHTVA